MERVQKLSTTSLTKTIFDFLTSIEPDIAKLNKDQIFKSSVDIFGNPLGYYSKSTEYITTNEALLGKGTKIKKEGDPYDFLQTGVFLPSIFANSDGEILTFGATDPKTDEILSNVRLLSKSFFGLTKEHKIELIKNKVLPNLQTSIRQLMKL